MIYLRNDLYSSKGQFCRYNPKNGEADFIAYELDDTITHKLEIIKNWKWEEPWHECPASDYHDASRDYFEQRKNI